MNPSTPPPAGSLRPAPATPVRGSQFAWAQAPAALIVIGTAAAFTMGPAIVALVSMIGSRLIETTAPPTWPILDAARICILLVLVAYIVQTRETE